MTTPLDRQADSPAARETPRVAVLMPIYNTQRYVAEAIASITAQTMTDWELIAVDDGSTDRSADVVADLASHDSRIRLLRLTHRGVANVNHGLAATRAPYVARMDSDDWCEPDRLQRQVDFLDTNPGCVAVGTWLIRTDPQGNPAGEQKPPLDHATIDAALMRGDGSSITQGTTMYRRAALDRVGGWRDRHGWVEDMDLYLRLAEVGQLANLPEFLYRYRRHPTSVCSTRYVQMRSRLHGMLADAYARRGLGEPPPLETLRPDMPPRGSIAGLFRSWACHAIHRGNGAVARRHALASLWREPWSPQSWRVMAWSLTT
jgi:glycosyltransferase involved in cell wall biosynthesis